MGILEDLKNLVGGTDEEAAAAREQGIGGALRAAPTNVGKAVNTAVQFGAVGDVSSTIGMATGADPVSGYRQSKEERGLGLATLFGFGGAASAMGVLAGTGRMSKKVREALDAAQNARADALAADQALGVQRMFRPEPLPQAVEQIAGMRQTGTQMLPVQKTISELAAANQPVSIWSSHAANGMIRYRDTHAFLEASPDPLTGYARHARTLVRTDDPVGLAQADGFVRAMGPRWANTTHYRAAGVVGMAGEDAERAQIVIAGFELSRFNAAIEKGVLASTQKHKKGRLATQAWEKLRNGEPLMPKETEVLSDVMEQFADAVWFLDSPELTGTPLAHITKVNLEGAEPVVGVRYKQFDAASIDQMTWKETNRRISALFAGDPTAMVPVLTSNITNFTKKFVDEHTMEYFRDWYPQARVSTGEAAARVGMDAERFIVLTAIMSPGQPWDANVPKAEAFARALKDLEAGKFKSPLQGEIPPKIRAAIEREMKDAGIKAKKGQTDDGSEITRLWAAMARGDYSDGKGQMIPLASAVQAVLVSKAKDPWGIFTKGTTRTAPTKSGLPAGLKTAGMKKLFEEGADPDELFAMRSNNPDQQLKVPSFTHAIARSDEEDLLGQGEYMAKLMHGGGIFREGLTDAEVMKSLRGELPVVVDRQAFKIAMGFSVLPDTFLSAQKDVFDSLAQAYRNASLELGVVPALGRHLLPEELQAATWVQYRMQGQVKFETGEIPQGFDVPESMNTNLNRARGTRRWEAGMTRPSPNTVLAGYTEGAGPDLIWDHSVWDLITGNADRLPWHGVDALDQGTNYGRFYTKVVDWFADPNPETRKRADSPLREIDVHMAPDGTMKILSPDTRPVVSGALNARYPIMGKLEFDEGPNEQVMAPSFPAPVPDARAILDKLTESTVHRAKPELRDDTGAAFFPTNAPNTLGLDGNHMWVSTVASMNAGDQFGVAAMRQVHAELTAAGIKAEITLTDPYIGITRPPLTPDKAGAMVPLWDPEEARQAAILRFETNDDLQAAAQWMLIKNEDGVANYKRIFQEEILDSRYYVDNDISAPPGTTAVYEHHFKDAQGRVLVNLNTAGDQFWSNSRKVYLPEEMASFVTPAFTTGLQPGAPMHTIDPWATVPPIEGLEVRGVKPTDDAWSDIEVRSPFGLYEVRTRDAEGKWSTWKKPKEFAVYIPDDGTQPQIAIGTDTIPGVDPTRIVRVRAGKEPEFHMTGDKKGEIKVDPDTKKEIWRNVTQMIPHTNELGEADAVYGRHVYELLRRVGFDGPMRATEWKRT